MSLPEPLRRAALPLVLLLAFALRFVWPGSDPPTRFSWSNGIYTDPATMVHAARNAVLFGEWIPDYNRDLFIYPLMNALTYAAYLPFGPGRLPTLFLAALAGTATVGALFWGLRRSVGKEAALLGALLAAVGFWLVGFSRIPIAENVVTMLLAFTCVAAMGRSVRSKTIAGALGVFATLFGKYHAVGFLPGLVLFLALRERSIRAVVPALLGGSAVFAVWALALFLPRGAEIVGHVGRQSTGLHGEVPFAISLGDGIGEIFNTLRRSWMFYRLPVCGVLGSLFAFWTLGNPKARRARLADGSAIYAFWFVSEWLYYSVLPYKAPRYYVLLAPPLVAGAAIVLRHLFTSQGWKLRAPQRWGEHVPLAIWLYALAFGSLDALKHYASMTLDYLTLPPPRISDEAFDLVVSVFRHIDTFRQNIVWAAVLSAVVYVFVLWNPEILARLGLGRPLTIRPERVRRFGITLFTISMVWSGWQFAWFAAHRTRYLEEVKSSLAVMVGDQAVFLGPLAPLLTQDTGHRALPYFGPPGERGLLEKYGVTHLAVLGSGDAEIVESRFPGVLDQTSTVQVWPVRTLFTSTLEIRRLPKALGGVPIHAYEPTLYEQAASLAEAERWREALDRFAAFRASGAPEIPELLSLESVCWFKLEDYDRARKLLEEAISRRPRDPLNYQNLGVLFLRVGDRAKALDMLMTALRLDPKNSDLEKMIQELAR